MKNRISLLLIVLFIFIALDVLLVYRYANWGCSMKELLPYIFFTVLSESMAIYSVYHFKQIINPFTIYSVFVYIAGFSFLLLSERQQPIGLLFFLILVASIFSFLIGGLTSIKLKNFCLPNLMPSLSPQFSFVFLLLFLLAGIGVFFLEIQQLGYLPLFNLTNASVYSDLTENEVTPLHNFIVLNSILPAMFFVVYKRGVIPLWVVFSLSAVSFFIILNFFSRQIIVLFFFSVLMAINYYKAIPFFKLAIFGIVCVVLFIILGELRSSSGDTATTASINAFLKEYADINKPTNILETYMSLYGGVNFTTGDKITTLAADQGYISYGVYMLRPVITLLPVDKVAIYPLEYSSYTNLGTYLVDPYLDFRWIGVISLNFIYGFFSMNSFKNYMDKLNGYYIVEWSLFLFCIFMCSFTNFFHMFFVVFFFLVNRIAIK